MTKNGMNPVHPGEVLREELDDLGVSANALAKAINVPANRVTAILNGGRGVTADTALRLGRYFDTTATFWLNLQQAWQLRQAEINGGATIRDCVIPRQAEQGRAAAEQGRAAEKRRADEAEVGRLAEKRRADEQQARADAAERELARLKATRS